MADNTITIAGNLTREPELRFTTSGTAVLSLSVAQNRRYMQNNEWVEAPTNFFNVTMFGQHGENVSASVQKGDRVVVVGRLDFRKYTNKDGIEVTTHDLIADEVCPSLKWATAEVARIQRTNSSAAPAAPQSRQGGRPADPIYGDEEPF